MRIIAYIVHKGHTLDVKVLAVKRILEQLDDIIADGVLGREAFCPCEDLALVQGSLFYGETEGETEWESGIAVVYGCGIFEGVGSGVSGRYGRGC